MCNTESSNQNNYYKAFIRDCVRDLKNNRSTYAYFDYQVEDIRKHFPHDFITVKKVNNYYILDIIKGRKSFDN